VDEPPNGRRPTIRDLLIGTALPLALLCLDPAIFQSSSLSLGPPLLMPFKAGCYAATAIFIAAMLIWVGAAKVPGLLSGVLGAGALFALVVGLVLLPFSILGTLFAMGLGLLGLAPFAMAYVYARRAVEAYRASGGHPLTRRVTAAAVGFMIPALAAAGVNVVATRAYESVLADVLGGGNRKVHRAVFRLRFLRYGVALDDMAWRYSREAGYR